MTKEDIDNLNLVLECYNDINNTNFQGIAERTGLDVKLLQTKLLPILINRKCISEKLIASSGLYDYRITPTGKEYFVDEKFKKEFEQEQMIKGEFTLIKWRIKTYWIHWAITVLAFLIAVYSAFIK